MSAHRWRSPLLLATIGLVALALWQPVVADPDMWGHVLFGRQFVHAPSLPTTNGYSFLVPDHPWITHEWGFQAIMGLAWEALGGRGLVALKGACVVLLLLVLVPGIHRRGDPDATAFLLVAVLALANIAMLVRPQLATLVLLAVVLRLLDAVLRGASPRLLVALPPLFALWVNLHGGFVVGLGLIGLAGCLVALALVAPQRSTAPASRRLLAQLAVTFVASAGATLLNPSGPGLWVFLSESLVHPPRFVTEWYPLHRSFDSVHAPAFVAVLLLALCVGLAGRSWTLPPLTLPGCAFVIFSLATFMSVRHMALAAVAGSLALAEAWPALLDRWRAGARGAAVTWTLRAIVALLALAAVAPAVPALRDGPGWLRVPDDAFPEQAMDAVKRMGVRGNAVVLYDWGCYALFRAWPDVRVDVDSRCDTAYPMAMLEESVEASRSRELGTARLRRIAPDLVVMPPGVIETWGLRDDPGWAILHEDPVAVVLVPSQSSESSARQSMSEP